MNIRNIQRQMMAILLIAGTAFTVRGQSVTYLTPEKYSATVGQCVSVGVEAGDGQVVRRALWPSERIEWLFVRGPETQENREDVAPRDAKSEAISVTPTRPGVTLVAFDTKPAVSRIEGKSFKAFARRVLPSEKFQSITAGIADKDLVPLRRIESAKTLMRVTDADGKTRRHSSVAQSKTGQIVELRPLADPTMVSVGSDLPLRAYLGGSSQAGMKVLATCAATGKTVEAVTDRVGTCHFKIGEAGVWRIEFHQIRQPEGDTGGELALHSATLTFEVTRTGEGK